MFQLHLLQNLPYSTLNNFLKNQSKFIIVTKTNSIYLLFTFFTFIFNSFVDAQQLRAQGMKKPDRVTVERRRRDGQLAVYHVVDSVANFKQSDW